MRNYEDFIIKKIDRKIAYYMQNTLSRPWMDLLMVFFTSLGNFCSIWIVIMLGMYLSGSRHYTYLMVIALLITNAVNNGFLKAIFRRKRPFEQYHDIDIFINDPFGSSFPSGHSATSFSAAVIIYAFNPYFGIFAYFIAAGVAFSRMYLRVHFFSDVLCGVITGILCSWFTLFYFTQFFI